MSARQEEASPPDYRSNQDSPGNDDGGTGSLSRNRVSVDKVYAMHGLLLSGIELALTVGNAVNQDAFQLNSFSDVIFGGSVIIETVGFGFAIAMALRLLLYPVEGSVIGVGVPAMVIVEALVVEGSVKDMSMLGFVGLGAQSASFLSFAAISLFKSPGTVSLRDGWIFVSGGLICLSFACYERSRNYHSTSNVVYCMFWAIPFGVEIAESALIFTSGAIPFVSYLLAVLDLVIIAPAASFILVSVAIIVIQCCDDL